MSVFTHVFKILANAFVVSSSADLCSQNLYILHGKYREGKEAYLTMKNTVNVNTNTNKLKKMVTRVYLVGLS